MNKVILDSSALLALIKNEAGADIIEPLLGNIVMSSVNITEVAAILLDSEMTPQECEEGIESIVDSIISFDFEQSILAATLKKSTKHLGLSLGDRACIALGINLKAPIYTADKIWSELKLDDAEIISIR